MRVAILISKLYTRRRCLIIFIKRKSSSYYIDWFILILKSDRSIFFKLSYFFHDWRGLLQKILFFNGFSAEFCFKGKWFARETGLVTQF